jgi:hypothetical protein
MGHTHEEEHMKSLRKKKEIKRVKDSSHKDQVAIKKLLSEGWEYCDKTTWRKLVGKAKEKEKKSELSDPRPTVTVMGLTQRD